MTSFLRRSPRSRFAVCTAGAALLALLSPGCQSRPGPATAQSEPPPARTSLPSKLVLPMQGSGQFFHDRLLVALDVEPVHSAEDDAADSGPRKGPKGKGGGRGGSRNGLTGGVQVQANNQGTSANSSVGYSVGPASIATNVGTNGFGGMQLGIGNGGGNRGGGGGANGGGPGGGAPKSAPGRGNQADPEALVHISLSNNSAEPLEIYLVDLTSPLGSFSVRPGHLVLAPDQTLDLDPLPSFLAAGLDHSEATLVLRVGNERETQTILLQPDTTKSAPHNTPSAGS